MIMDKGLSMAETENMVARSEHLIDYVKFGFGTSYATINLEEKLAFYKENNIRTYFGGTLFEAFFVRGQYEDYKRLLDKFDMPVVEVSDGSCEIPEDKKCEMIAGHGEGSHCTLGSWLERGRNIHFPSYMD